MPSAVIDEEARQRRLASGRRCYEKHKEQRAEAKKRYKREHSELYGYRCLCCGQQFSSGLTVDHVVPLALGGSNWISNIQPLCHHCNSKKHTKIIDYRVHFEEREAA